ncbi:hypothetical protein WMY93_007508 [Mugilogobius chulae]|uniref:Uncharacterized protein n=1 Tax=Mugilogobius chulae TaxID=88201 RepID=A0AAW0PM63_9GOBI
MDREHPLFHLFQLLPSSRSLCKPHLPLHFCLSLLCINSNERKTNDDTSPAHTDGSSDWTDAARFQRGRSFEEKLDESGHDDDEKTTQSNPTNCHQSPKSGLGTFDLLLRRQSEVQVRQRAKRSPGRVKMADE